MAAAGSWTGSRQRTTRACVTPRSPAQVSYRTVACAVRAGVGHACEPSQIGVRPHAAVTRSIRRPSTEPPNVHVGRLGELIARQLWGNRMPCYSHKALLGLACVVLLA